MSLREQLAENYKSYEPSTKDYLDGRYFNEVFKDVENVQKHPMLITFNRRHVDEEKTKFKEAGYGVTSLVNYDSQSKDPVILRIVIRIQDVHLGAKTETLTTLHSNLLVIYPSERKIYRFEPLSLLDSSDERAKDFLSYSSKVDSILQEQFPEFDGFEYAQIDLHPQEVDLGGERPHGMCMAYVLYAATMLSLGRSVEFPSELDIKRFASAVETLVNKALTDQGKTLFGKPDIEFGPGFLEGVAAVGAAALAGAVVGGTYSAYSPYGYSPYGYGYSPYGYRGYSPYGYGGWGYPHHHHHGW